MMESPLKESLKYIQSSSNQIKEDTLHKFHKYMESCSDEMTSLQMATKMELDWFNKAVQKKYANLGASLEGEFKNLSPFIARYS
jgi:hypothetical protein